MRTFGLTATDAGMRMGLAFGIPPVIAALIGGWMYDQLKRKSWRLALGVPAICCALSSVVGIAGWMSNDAFTRSEEHTSELQSLMRISYAVFCLKKKTNTKKHQSTHTTTTDSN